MSELAKGFGVYSLPIRVVRYTQRSGKTILTLYMGEKINNYLLSTNRSHVFPVLEFMAKSANLMPEAVELLKQALRELEDLTEEQRSSPFEVSKPHKACVVVAKIDALLAKLEGGTNNAQNP